MSCRPTVPSRAVRVLTAVLVACGAVASGVTLSSPATADEVGRAQQQVARLQTLVADTTKELVEGTRQWEADQARLRKVQRQLRTTQRHIAEQQQVVAAATAHVGLIARRMYMHPVATGLQVAFTQSPQSALDALQVQDAANHVAGADGQLILRAQRARLQLRRDQAEAERYARSARDLVARSAARLAHLKALAEDTAHRLDVAQSALARARAAQAARLARLRAARLRALAARDGAACTSHSTAGQQNGNLDPATLCQLWMAPGHRLRWDAATAFNRMSQYHAAALGTPLCVTDSYRSYSEQVDVYRRKPSLAAVPGTSNHGWGVAVDFCGGVQDPGSPAHAWMQANAGRFGWHHPDWAEPGGSKPEAWHWEYGG